LTKQYNTNPFRPLFHLGAVTCRLTWTVSQPSVVSAVDWSPRLAK